MTYRYNIINNGNYYEITLQDMSNINAYATSKESAIKMPKSVLQKYLTAQLQSALEIPKPKSSGEYKIKVDEHLSSLIKKRAKKERKARKAFAKHLKVDEDTLTFIATPKKMDSLLLKKFANSQYNTCHCFKDNNN